MGFAPISAADGEEALHKAIAEKPHLILIELLMPEMAGFEAMQMLRKNPATGHIPIVATMPFFNEQYLQKCLELGCNGFLVKPFTFQELETRLLHFLGSDSEAPRPAPDLSYRGHRIVWDIQPLPGAAWSGRAAVVLPAYVDGIERVYRVCWSDHFMNEEEARHHLIGAAKEWIDDRTGNKTPS
jgi:CheY-like chemotaxis protein